MHIIVDTNVYENDFGMSGGVFNSLFDYVGKTTSRLVIPRVVWDETCFRYLEALKQRQANSKKAVGSLNAILFTSKAEIPEIDPQIELSNFKEKLRHPRKDIPETLLLEDYAGISVEEIVRRGVHKIPPASQSGEELRDVVLWLAAIAHSRSFNERVVLISGDKTFGNPVKLNELHPLLAQELADSRLDFVFYASVDEFIKAHALKFESIGPDFLYKLIPKEEVDTLFCDEVVRRTTATWHGERTALIVRYEIEFIKGSMYQVTSTSRYCELDFKGSASVSVLDWPYPPPEARLPADVARLARMNQAPVNSFQENIEATMQIGVRAVDGKVTDTYIEEFEMKCV